MPSKDSKTPGKDDANVVKFNAKDEKQAVKEKNRPGLTVSKVVTYVILALLAVVMVFGVFPSFGSGGSSSNIEFGSFDGTPIEFSYGNYFYRQYQQQAQQNKATGDAAAYQIWRAAFESTVFQTAMSKKAEDAGIRVVGETLNKAIIDSGVYDKDGKFDIATYEKASIESKNQVKVRYEESLPVQMAMNDITSVLSAPAELDYIVQMGDTARSFEYAVFDSNAYPDDLTRQYAQANPALFTMIDISVISLADEATAQSVRSSIESGSTTFEEAAKTNSRDSFAAEGGRAGTWYLFELQDNFSVPEEVNVLYSTPVGQVSQAFAAPNGYVLYRVEQAPFLADFEDAEVLADVKAYIGTRDAEVVTAYLEGKAQEFAAVAATSDDFAAAAEDAGVQTISVEATPVNVGGSNYLAGFAYTDMGGYLNALANDTEAMKMLYTTPVGEVSTPLSANNAFIVAKVTGESAMDSEMSDYLKLVYPYMAQSQSQQDLIQSIFTSEKLEDNFLIAFMENIMGVGASK
jgi:parvulin-like peptidyl-prolyl isomerase